MGDQKHQNIPYTDSVHHGGITTHFKIAGKGPLLVLVHGFPDNWDAWEYQIGELAQTYTVVTPALRGYPPSSIPDNLESYALTDVAGDLIAILDYLGVDKAIVGGHDFGGAAAQTLALLHPERLLGLIIINSPLLPVFTDLVIGDKEQHDLSKYTKAYFEYQPGMDKNEDYVVRNIREPERREVIRKYLVSSPMHGMMNYYKRNYPGSPYGNPQDTSAFTFTVPSLIIWGLEEEYFSFNILSQAVRLFPSGLRLVTIPGAGHWSFRDKWNEVNVEIKSWLQRL